MVLQPFLHQLFEKQCYFHLVMIILCISSHGGFPFNYFITEVPSNPQLNLPFKPCLMLVPIQEHKPLNLKFCLLPSLQKDHATQISGLTQLQIASQKRPQ